MISILWNDWVKEWTERRAHTLQCAWKERGGLMWGHCLGTRERQGTPMWVSTTSKERSSRRWRGGGSRARVSFLLDAGTLGSSAARTHKPLVKRAPSPHVAVNPSLHLREEPLLRAVPVTRWGSSSQELLWLPVPLPLTKPSAPGLEGPCLLPWHLSAVTSHVYPLPSLHHAHPPFRKNHLSPLDCKRLRSRSCVKLLATVAHGGNKVNRLLWIN